MGSQGMIWAPLGQGTPACLALQWVLVLGKSCTFGWWPLTRRRAGWLAVSRHR